MSETQSKERRLARAIVRSAFQLFQLFEETKDDRSKKGRSDPKAHTRILDSPNIPKEWLIFSESIASKSHPSGHIKDHMVPLKVIRDSCFKKFQSEPEPTGNECVRWAAEFIVRNLRICIITQQENALLTERKLKSDVPENWILGDVDARYIASNIDLTAHPLRTDLREVEDHVRSELEQARSYF